MIVTQTKNGLRFSQHGVVISELRLSPGPTHSVFDLLAATLDILNPNGPIGLLGFAGGGMIAPLRALDITTPIETCDLDQKSYHVFKKHAPHWSKQVQWHHAEAVQWLQHQPPRHFSVLIDDLSIPHNQDIIKPAVSWHALPALIRQKLKPDGTAVFNLMPPAGNAWTAHLQQVIQPFHAAQIVHLEEFENRILLAGRHLPDVRETGRRMRDALRRIGSRQAGRMHLRTLHR
jgi:hypothetical protein